jgi:hypothetical protein
MRRTKKKLRQRGKKEKSCHAGKVRDYDIVNVFFARKK